MKVSISEVYDRQMRLFNPREHQVPITILGCGSTGSFAALALAKLGLKEFILWDGDDVEVHNFPSQLHRGEDVGKNKTLATSEILENFLAGLGTISVQTIPEMYEEGQLSGIVICAADSMKAREIFWQEIKMSIRVRLYLDPRMGGEGFRLYSILPTNPDCIELYESSLYSDEEADPPVCGERAIIDMAFLIASRITLAVRKFIVKGEVNPLIIEDVSRETIQFNAVVKTVEV